MTNNIFEQELIFKNFKKISKIPHGSGNTKAISDYCVEVAKKNNCSYVQDEANNVIVYLDGTKGYEKSKPVILQGHLDMVCEKTQDCDKNMETDAIDILVDGDYIIADKTTLGGDDGIAVAYMLSLIEDKSIEHPPLELLFTTDEEIGMLGATALNADLLNGKTLINIDSEEEGVLTVGCAGGVRAFCKIPFANEKCDGVGYKITISGLRGGHSGVEINAGRTNAIKLIARMLNHINQELSFKIASVKGGKAYNAIPKCAEAVICVSDTDKEKFLDAMQRFADMIKREKSNEPDLNISISQVDNCKECMDALSTKKIIFALLLLPNGVQNFSSDIPEMVQTSLSLGNLKTNKSFIEMNILIRSNIATGKQAVVYKVKSFVEYLEGKVEFSSDYPAWEYKTISPLRDIMAQTYNEMFGENVHITAIHAGLECGILSNKIKDIDIVSFGPDILNIHTPKEKLDIKSALRSWKYLKAVLKKLR